MSPSKQAAAHFIAPFLTWILFILCTSASGEPSNSYLAKQVPTGEPYKLSASSSTRTGLASIAFDIATAVREKPPYDIINQLLGYSDKKTSSSQVLDYEIPFLALAGVSLVFAAMIPLIGLLFCICRLAGSCGGDLDDSKVDIRPTKKRKRYTLGITICSIFILFGCIVVFVSTSQMRSAIPKARASVSSSFDDVITFKNNTFKELNYIVGVEFVQALENLLKEVIGLARDIAEPVLQKGEPFVAELVSRISRLGSTVENSLDTIIKIQAVVSSLVTNGNQLSSELSSAKQNLTHARNACNTKAFNKSVCDVIPAGSELETVADFSKVPNITETGGKVQEVVQTNLTNEAVKGNETFTSLPDKIGNLTKNLTAEFRNFSTETETKSEDTLRPLEDKVDKYLQERFLIYRDKVDKYFDSDGMVPKYDGYRHTVYVIITVFVIITVIIMMIGIILAMCGASTFDTPSTRGDLSDLGGKVLMGSAGLLIILALFINSLAGLAFFAGANTAVVCSGASDYQLLKETIDNPSLADGYPLAEMLFNDGSIELTISGVLSSCSDNQATWSAMQLDRIFNLTTVFNYKDKIPELEEVFVDLNNTVKDHTGMTDKAKTGVEDSLNAGVQNVNFSSYHDQTRKPIVNVSLADYAMNISEAAGASGMPPDAQELLTVTAAQLHQVHADVATTSQAQAKSLESLVNELEQQASAIVKEVNEVQESLVNIQGFLTHEALYIAAKAVSVHTRRVFDKIDEFLKLVTSQLRHDVGRCKPLYNVYQSLTSTVCYQYIGGLNTSWVGFGLCALFTTISIILCVRSAKHFRRVRKADPTRDSGDWDDADEMPWQAGFELSEPKEKLFPFYNNRK